MRNVILLAAAIASLGAGYWFAHTYRPPIATPLTTPPPSAKVDFELPLLDGARVSLDRWAGKLILLNFWATWCPPCLEEIPLFVAAQKRHASAGLQIVGVAIDRPAAVREFSIRHAINYPILLDDGTGAEIMFRYGNRSGSLPFSVLITPAGEVSDTKLGAYKQKELERLLQERLAGVPSRVAP